MAKLVYSVKEAAEVLGLSERTIYEMAYKNQIPHRRIEARGKQGQGRILIPIKALDDWLAGNDAPESKPKRLRAVK